MYLYLELMVIVQYYISFVPVVVSEGRHRPDKVVRHVSVKVTRERILYKEGHWLGTERLL